MAEKVFFGTGAIAAGGEAAPEDRATRPTGATEKEVLGRRGLKRNNLNAFHNGQEIKRKKGGPKNGGKSGGI